MAKFGQVDFTIADIDPRTGDVGKFVSVELQAVDITGSYEPAYSAIINREPDVRQTMNYGFNWANVRKLCKSIDYKRVLSSSLAGSDRRGAANDSIQ